MAHTLAVEILLHLLKDAHESLEATMDGVTDEIAAAMPPGKANPIAGTYAHLVMSEDFFLNGVLKGEKPLFETTWKDKTGASEVQPTEWETAFPTWLKEVKVDIAQVREYAKAVYEVSEAYVGSLTDQDLTKKIDMSMFGMGEREQYNVIGSFLIGHTRDICGEVSVLKGIQGLKGYPW